MRTSASRRSSLCSPRSVPKGRRAEWRFHPAWVFIDKVEHQEFGLQRLALRSRGTSVEVAGFLGADAKADFRLGVDACAGGCPPWAAVRLTAPSL